MSRVRRDCLPDEKALPKTLVCIDLRASSVLDLTDGKIRQRLRVSIDTMTDETAWKKENYHNRESLTQAIGRAVFTAGFEALIAPSAADQPHGQNLIIFPENLHSKSSFTVVTPINK